ncbi:MAG: hypothetical protein AB1813_00940 [Verrucomicrobiota bacterium]
MKDSFCARRGRGLFLVLLMSSLAVRSVLAADPVFSGPQPGEAITPFKAVELRGPDAGKEVDALAGLESGPVALAFVHGVERSMAPLLTVIDQYGSERKDRLKTLFVFLSGDRTTSEKHLPMVGQSLRLQCPMLLSVDGAEGPGNYGLNKQCLLTLLVARDKKVTANFALVQPGIADAPRIIQALASTCEDANPPTPEELRNRRQALYGDSGRGAMNPERRARAAQNMDRIDLSRFDLNTENGLRDAVKTLLAEVQSLRQEIAALKQSGREGNSTARREPERKEIPGAAPTDPELVSMLRAFIQRSNDEATVDRIVKQVEEYVKGKSDLTQQTIDGWTRVLFLKYGTDYAQKQGQALIERLRSK